VKIRQRAGGRGQKLIMSENFSSEKYSINSAFLILHSPLWNLQMDLNLIRVC
jgi:hypothetical protein